MRALGISRGINLIANIAAGMILLLLAIVLITSLTGCCSIADKPGNSPDEQRAFEQLRNEHRGSSAALQNYRGKQ